MTLKVEKVKTIVLSQVIVFLYVELPEGPAGTTLSLVLDGGHIALLAPVHCVRQGHPQYW